MDDKRAASFSSYLSDLHDSNRKIIQSKKILDRYCTLMAGAPRAPADCKINYAKEAAASLRVKLKSFFLAPTGSTPVLIANVDEKREWIRLIRFVARNASEFNAETMSLTCRGTERFNGFGFRYEHPEIKGDEHNFFHIQPIRVTSASEIIPGAPSWLPDHFPTFYMRAENSYELSIYALSSLCGWRALKQYQSTSRDSCWLLQHLVRQGTAALDAAEASL